MVPSSEILMRTDSHKPGVAWLASGFSPEDA